MISEHRGYQIWKIDKTSFEIRSGTFVIARCGSAWSCITYIDEMLAP